MLTAVAKQEPPEIREVTPITFIPFGNIACYMDKSDIETFFRKCFYDYLQQIEQQFDKYVADTDVQRLSLNDFFYDYARVGCQNGCAGVKGPPIKQEIKLEKSFCGEAGESPASEPIGIECPDDPISESAADNLICKPQPDK